MIFFASCKRSRSSQIVNRSSLGAMRQPGGVSSGSRMVESIPANINARWARSASERCRNPCAGAMSLLMPSAKLSDCRRKRKVERERRVRIVAQRRAERRGGSSSPASGLAIRNSI